MYDDDTREHKAKAEEAPLFSLNCPDQLGSVGADVCNQHSQE